MRGITDELQYVARQVFAHCQIFKTRIDKRRIHAYLLAAVLAGFKRDLFQQPFHHRVQTPSADVFSGFVDLEGNLREAANTLGRELDIHAFGCQQRLVLAGQASVGGR